MRNSTFLAVLACVVTCGTTWASVQMPADAPTDVQFAVRMLQSPEHEDRAQAASWVGSLGEEAAPAVPYLVKMLGDTSIGHSNPTPYGPTWASYGAHNSLTMIGKPAVPALVNALKGPDWEIRYQAVQTLGSMLQAKSDSDDDRWLKPIIMSALGNMGVRDAIKPMIDALSSRDAEMRSSAASALVSIGTDEAVGKAATMLQDPDYAVRSHIAEALGKAKSARAVEPLIAALGDKSDWVVSPVIRALGEIGDQRAIEPLKQLMSRKSSQIRGDASYALIKLGDHSQVDAVVQALADGKTEIDALSARAVAEASDPAVIEAALAAMESGRNLALATSVLARSKDPRITPVMAGLLKSDDVSVYMMVLSYFGREKGPDAVDALIANLSSNDSSKVDSIISALQKTGDKRAAGPVLDMLKTATGYTRIIIMEALSTLGVSNQAERLLINFTQDNEPVIRWFAAGLLGEIKTDASVRTLITALSDKNAGVRSKAADSLGLIGTDAAVKALIDQLMDPNSPIRPDATRALGIVGGPRVESYLTAALKDNSNTVRREAASALKPKESPEATKGLSLSRRMSDWCVPAAMSIFRPELYPSADKRTVTQLVAAIKDPDPKNRLLAISVLHWRKDSAAVESLIEAMQTDPSGEVRTEAARALAYLKDSRATAPMLAILASPPKSRPEPKITITADRATLMAVLNSIGDSNEYVAAAATNALRQMTLQDFGTDKGKWSEWISKNAKP